MVCLGIRYWGRILRWLDMVVGLLRVEDFRRVFLGVVLGLVWIIWVDDFGL